jgi:hypothetical protein
MPMCRQLVAGLSPVWPGFKPRPIYMGSVKDNVTPEQVFLRVLKFSAVGIIPAALHTYSLIEHRRYITLAPDTAVKHNTLQKAYS